MLRVDEKHLREHYVFNCLGFIITTNHKTDGIYLPPTIAGTTWPGRTAPKRTSRRLLERAVELVRGRRLRARRGLPDRARHFSLRPKAPPPKTPAFWDIVNANNAPEDAELADVLDALGCPDAVTPKQLIAAATGATAEWLTAHKSRRSIPHRLERCGYSQVRNKDAKDGYWLIDGTRQPVYAKTTLSEHERYKVTSSTRTAVALFSQSKRAHLVTELSPNPLPPGKGNNWSSARP